MQSTKFDSRHGEYFFTLLDIRGACVLSYPRVVIDWVIQDAYNILNSIKMGQ